jgi:hypothetical protein
MRAAMPPFYPRAPVGSPLSGVGSYTDAASVRPHALLPWETSHWRQVFFLVDRLPYVAARRPCAADPTWGTLPVPPG